MDQLQVEDPMGESHPLVELARRSIRAYVTDGRQIRPPQEIPPEMRRRAGAFVTIRLHGSLRGCIGTIEPACDNLADEVIRNAVAVCLPALGTGPAASRPGRNRYGREAGQVDSRAQSRHHRPQRARRDASL